MVTSDNLSAQAYRHHAYSRSSTAFYVLFRYLGEEKFSKALQVFTERWNGKHPTPYDLFYTFDHIADENLEWFWKPWFFDLAYADLAIGEIENNRVEIINKGGFPVEVKLILTTKDGKTHNYGAKANIWKNGIKSVWINIAEKDIVSYKLGTELVPDAFLEDNFMER